MPGIVINFSGHPLSEEAAKLLESKFDQVVNAKPIEFNFADEVEAQLKSIVECLPCVVDGSRPITIIPPGQSTLSILLVSYLHGIMGHFPAICYLELAANGRYMPRVEYLLSVQTVRSAGRRFRSTIYAA